MDVIGEVHIHIDEVIVEGAEMSDPDGFRAAFEATLVELARDHGGGYPDGVAPVLHGEPVAAPDGADVARSVWHSIVPDRGTP